ncbi:MAG: VWA domain-containing protein, partial [Flavobacteriaceae bacterium]|nr:VWA domain-containing protein [Flavobacteriaceae bacterium]
MQTLTIIYIFLVFVLSLLLVYFQYFFREGKNRAPWVLFLLRFIAVFSMLLLLINPKIEQKHYDIIRPKLMIAVDN